MLSNTLQNNIFNRLVVGFKANFLLVGPGPIGGMHCVGGLSKGSYPVFSRVSLKATENSERQGRQARPGFEPGTSRLPVLSVTLRHWWGQKEWEESERFQF